MTDCELNYTCASCKKTFAGDSYETVASDVDACSQKCMQRDEKKRCDCCSEYKDVCMKQTIHFDRELFWYVLYLSEGDADDDGNVSCDINSITSFAEADGSSGECWQNFQHYFAEGHMNQEEEQFRVLKCDGYDDDHFIYDLPFMFDSSSFYQNIVGGDLHLYWENFNEVGSIYKQVYTLGRLERLLGVPMLDVEPHAAYTSFYEMYQMGYTAAV